MMDKLEDIFVNSNLHCLILHGPNYSGRTRALRSLSKIGDVLSVSPRNFYIPIEAYNAISGLAPTVAAELEFHSLDVKECYFSNVIEMLHLRKLLIRNPFTLSGGEQVLLLLACSLLFKPNLCVIDCAFEQLAPELRNEMFKLINNAEYSQNRFIICDNRLFEFINNKPHLEFINVASVNTKYLPLEPDVKYSFANTENQDLIVDAVTFGYTKADEILHDVSCKFQLGKVNIIQGPNGAGKSTLAKILAGVLKPTKGFVCLGNEKLTPWRYPGQKISYHFQNPDVQLFQNTVEQELISSLQIGGLSKSNEIIKDLKDIAEIFGLTNVLSEHPQDLELPFPVRKRISLAATFALRRPWIILDEPTLGQDDKSITDISKILFTALSYGVGIIVISHSKSFLAKMPHKMFVLEKGQLQSKD
jgi:energy-coupling factor transporter ATP-binding protein EcfA2